MLKSKVQELCMEAMEKYLTKDLSDITPQDINKFCGSVALKYSEENWNSSKEKFNKQKSVAYISMEYLMGRAIVNNLLNLGIYDEVVEFLEKKGVDVNIFEDIADQNLGNGGLGRLAACYLESAATKNLPVCGYGIRYKKGFFKQAIVEGQQVEYPDNWLDGDLDPWSIRVESEKVLVEFSNQQSVWAVPYDIPIFGYATDTVGTLRVWQAEPVGEISDSLYPNDEDDSGKLLRLSQEYLLTYATIVDLIRKYEKRGNVDFKKFHESFAIQLNDTHPVMGIPILLNLLEKKYNISHKDAVEVIQKTFSYTNHTILSEALEQWDGSLMRRIVPELFETINKLNIELIDSMRQEGYSYESINPYQFIVNDRVYMARIAIYFSHKVNGVAKVHTDILKNYELNEWHRKFPEKIINVTNGITPRRWLAYANKPMRDFITRLLGTDEWISKLEMLSELYGFSSDAEVITEFTEIKKKAKVELAEYIKRKENVTINPEALVFVQVKRIHEYKRQLLNILGAYDYYIRLKNGELDINEMPPVVEIIGGKAAPGYRRAKAIIRLAKRLQNIVNNDEDTNEKFKFVFISNFNVSYGEKVYPAADVSKQISTAGKEASGTGNMKFMINGAVTLGTFDGANIEIFKESGLRNNYAFGAVVDELKHARRDGYWPRGIYTAPANTRLKRAIDFLIQERHSNRDQGVEELYRSLTEGWYGEVADPYFLLKDFYSFVDAQDKAILDSKNPNEFYKKGFINMAKSGKFTSDRSIVEYAENIWEIKPIK